MNAGSKQLLVINNGRCERNCIWVAIPEKNYYRISLNSSNRQSAISNECLKYNIAKEKGVISFFIKFLLLQQKIQFIFIYLRKFFHILIGFKSSCNCYLTIVSHCHELQLVAARSQHTCKYLRWRALQQQLTSKSH